LQITKDQFPSHIAERRLVGVFLATRFDQILQRGETIEVYFFCDAGRVTFQPDFFHGSLLKAGYGSFPVYHLPVKQGKNCAMHSD
ncbi:MAG: hypothetical protein O6931_05735, partial [Gammaproteobacteria bacterium]|nr:hypothetical protein [Gammaproteobacteria bacterium]